MKDNENTKIVDESIKPHYIKNMTSSHNVPCYVILLGRLFVKNGIFMPIFTKLSTNEMAFIMPP